MAALRDALFGGLVVQTVTSRLDEIRSRRLRCEGIIIDVESTTSRRVDYKYELVNKYTSRNFTNEVVFPLRRLKVYFRFPP